MIWNAEKIRAELKLAKKSIVFKSNGECTDLSFRSSVRLDGDFKVEETPFEVVVHDNYRRKPE
jgi:hypothetical protein